MNPYIEGLFSQFKEDEGISVGDNDAFEMFAASLALSDDILSQVELSDLLLDPGTPGVDTLILDVNGQIIQDVEELDSLASESSRLDVSLTAIQAKYTEKVDGAQLLNFGDTIDKIINNEDFDSHYKKLISISETFRSVFRYAGKLVTPPTVRMLYITAAANVSVTDTKNVSKVERVRSNLSKYDFVNSVDFDVWGAQEIQNARQKKITANSAEISLVKQINLPSMPGVDQAILGSISASELIKMISVDSDMNMLDERVFYENVRGFQGVDNPVNKAMMQTMAGEDSSLLMVLNNGITVVAESYSPKPGDAVYLSGYQIVNGCQTSNCLFASRGALEEKLESTYLPIKIVVTKDSEIAAQIIRATNSQTAVKETSLIALSEFQKRLEESYKQDIAGIRLNYERRAGQFYAKDVVKNRIVSINDQLRSFSAVVLRLPHNAARYPGKLYQEVGKLVFDSDHKELPYMASAYMAYKLENAFRTGLKSEYKTARYHLLLVSSYIILGRVFSDPRKKNSEADARKVIEYLNSNQSADLFDKSAKMIIEAAGGELPSRDRLKGSAFTNELIAFLGSKKSL